MVVVVELTPLRLFRRTLLLLLLVVVGCHASQLLLLQLRTLVVEEVVESGRSGC